MELSIKTYKYIKTEQTDTKFQLPDEPTYWFETGIRRAIRIVPNWTTWLIENGEESEKLYQYHVTCVYNSFESKVESYKISISDFEDAFNKERRLRSSEEFIYNWLSGWFDKRTKEKFEADLNAAILKFNDIN